RTKSGQAALVRDLGQRVDLVHELRQLGRAEELADDADERRRVQQVARGDQRLVLNGHAVADDARHLREADADLVLEQLAHAADAAVAEVVDVVELDGEVAVEEVRDRGLPSAEGLGEVREGEPVLLEALLRDVDVVVSVLLVQVDEGELVHRLAVDLLRVVGEEGLVLGEALVLRAALGHGRGLRLAVGEVGDAAVQRDQVLHRGDDVLEAQRAARERRQREVLVLAAVRARHDVAADGELPEIVVQLDGDLVPADLGEVVLAQVLEDQVVEVRLGLAGDDELLAAQLLVDVLLGFLDGLDLVLAQGLEDRWVVLLRIAGEDLDARHFLVEHALDRFVSDLLAGLEKNLSRGLVHDVLARNAMQKAFHRRGTDFDRLEGIENLENIRVGLDAAGAKEAGRLELLLAVDADVKDVVEVEFELDPGAAV